MSRVRVRDLVFDGGAGDVSYTIESIDGLDGVDMRRESRERPAAHGVFAAPGYLEGRTVTWRGLCFTSSAEAQEHESRRIAGLLASGGYERFTFDVPGGSVWGDFGRFSKPRFESVLPGSIARYEIKVFAPDPYLYGDTHTYAGNNGVTFPTWHYGNTDATDIELQVFGNQSASYTIEAQGKSFVVTQDLQPDQIHHIYPASGELVIDGAVIAGGIASAPVLTVPAGVQTNYRLVSPTLSELKVIVRDTYA